jgi:hypothetical protein
MLYREITAVCSQIHTKHINTLCGQKVEFAEKFAETPVHHRNAVVNLFRNFAKQVPC